jgi:hypothetical protein
LDDWARFKDAAAREEAGKKSPDRPKAKAVTLRIVTCFMLLFS